MANTITERRPSNIHDLATIFGTLDGVTMDKEMGEILKQQIDKAVDASKYTFHARNDRQALIAQAKSNPMWWGVA